jgi:hypothetical protein
MFAPQHFTVPLLRSAHVELYPADTALVGSRFGTFDGVTSKAEVVPLPS